MSCHVICRICSEVWSLPRVCVGLRVEGRAAPACAACPLPANARLDQSETGSVSVSVSETGFGFSFFTEAGFGFSFSPRHVRFPPKISRE